MCKVHVFLKYLTKKLHNTGEIYIYSSIIMPTWEREKIRERERERERDKERERKTERETEYYGCSCIWLPGVHRRNLKTDPSDICHTR